ncbi:hypothetical protein PR048_024915 [Dryococelus australis]|uniref:Uncharacterized protein n=1 Tax=Dryococelus australis TaxID=614101 RepID=A0ABQ9GPY5_9NEOP|nr:hypothetical protein PR048_024915 [Dryococelus australis]
MRSVIQMEQPRCRGGEAARAFASQQDEPGSFPSESPPDFRMWKSCRAMPLVGGFSWWSPVCPALAFRRCLVHIPLHPHRLSRPHRYLKVSMREELQQRTVPRPDSRNDTVKKETRGERMGRRRKFRTDGVFCLKHFLRMTVEEVNGRRVRVSNEASEACVEANPRTSGTETVRQFIVSNSTISVEFTTGHMASIQVLIGSQLASPCTKNRTCSISSSRARCALRTNLFKNILVEENPTTDVLNSEPETAPKLKNFHPLLHKNDELAVQVRSVRASSQSSALTEIKPEMRIRVPSKHPSRYSSAVVHIETKRGLDTKDDTSLFLSHPLPTRVLRCPKILHLQEFCKLFAPVCRMHPRIVPAH